MKYSVQSFFGEQELRAITTVCYFTHILKQNKMARAEVGNVVDRVVKLVVILVGEVISVKDSKDN